MPYPDSEVNGANLEPIWGRQDPGMFLLYSESEDLQSPLIHAYNAEFQSQRLQSAYCVRFLLVVMDKLCLMIWPWEMINMIYHFASQSQTCQLLNFFYIERKLWKVVQSQVEHMRINF